MPSEAASMNCLQFENPANYRWAHRQCGLTMHMHWVVTFQAPHCFRLLQSTLCDRQRDLGAGQWAHRCICVRSRDRWHTGRGLQVPEGGYNTGHCPAVSRDSSLRPISPSPAHPCRSVNHLSRCSSLTPLAAACTTRQVVCVADSPQNAPPVQQTLVPARLQVKRGVLYTREEAEGKRLRNPVNWNKSCWAACTCHASMCSLIP
jgi:hypothetical protein